MRNSYIIYKNSRKLIILRCRSFAKDIFMFFTKRFQRALCKNISFINLFYSVYYLQQDKATVFFLHEDKK